MKEPSASCCTHFDLQLGLSLYFIFSPAPRKGNQSITLSGEGCHKWFAVILWTQDSSCTIVSVQPVFVEEKGQGGGKELYLLQTHLSGFPLIPRQHTLNHHFSKPLSLLFFLCQ